MNGEMVDSSMIETEDSPVFEFDCPQCSDQLIYCSECEGYHHNRSYTLEHNIKRIWNTNGGESNFS